MESQQTLQGDADASDNPAPSAAPAVAEESSMVYVVGDAGEDDFIPQTGKHFRVPAGATFVAGVMREVLVTETKCLAQPARDGVASYSALAPRLIELKRYDGPWRICRYAHRETLAKKTRGATTAAQDTAAATKFCLGPSQLPLAKTRILVAHNAGEPWADGPASAHAEFVQRFVKIDRDEFAFVIVNASDALPHLVIPDRTAGAGSDLDQGHAPGTRDCLEFASSFWEGLRSHPDSVAIVTSLTALRQAGVLVTRRLSWEQGVEELAAELYRFPRLRALTQFGHLFIRLGIVGFLHLQRSEGKAAAHTLVARVHFSPYVESGVYRDHEVEGSTIGRNTVFITALVEHMLKRRQHWAKDDLDKPVFDRALRAIRLVQDKGYEDDIVSGSDPERGLRLIAELAKHIRDTPVASSAAVRRRVPDYSKGGRKKVAKDTAMDADQWLASCAVPAFVLTAPSQTLPRSVRRWHILDEALRDAPVHRVNVAMAIVVGGHERVINQPWVKAAADKFVGTDEKVWKLLKRVEYYNPKDEAPDYVTLRPGTRPAIPEWPLEGPPTDPIIGPLHRRFEICVPVTRFGDLALIERDEIETMRGIHNLLSLYRDQAKRATSKVPPPISIAVFGPPGSGKSFAVKQIASELGGPKLIPQLEFNVSQFRGVQDLSLALQAAVTSREEKSEVTPLVFFDEFDCAWDGKELGWLKYFLGPMQDGTFQGVNGKIGPAILVFAGGVHASFDRFDPATDSSYDNLRELDEYKQRLKLFVDQKGPDFISRLRGHINVLEINDTLGRGKHFIRRALQLRGLLEANGRVEQGGLFDGRASIDDAIVYALLTVDRYRHGVRSMQAIVEMCSPIYGRIEIASLPPRAHLNMHVDAEEFLIRIQRGRLRAQPEWNPRDKTPAS